MTAEVVARAITEDVIKALRTALSGGTTGQSSMGV